MIEFNNVSVLAYSQNPKFLGENSFNYSTEKRISINGYIYNFSFFDGVSGIISGLNGLIQASNQTGDIYINGFNVGRGFVENLTVDNGNWVRLADYSADIKILDTGNLFNLTGKYFNNIDINFLQDNLYAVEDISESFDVTIDSPISYNYNRNLEISFDKAFEYNGAQTIAQAIASHIFSTLVPFQIFSGINIFSGVKKYYEESYDIINKKFAFKERATRLKNSLELADIIYSYNIKRNDIGIFEVKESASIQGFNESDIFSGALSKLEFVKSNSFSNCNRVLSGYFNLNDSPMSPIPMSQGYDINKFEGKINIESVYSNDISNESGYSWTLQRESSIEEEDSIIEISMMLNVNGYGSPNTDIKYNNAKRGLAEKKILITGKAYDFYNTVLNRVSNRLCEQSGFLHGVSEKISSSYYNGSIDYSMSFSDKEIPIDNEDFYEFQTESETPSITEYSNYYVSNEVYRQQYPQTTLGEKNIKRIRKYKKPVDFFREMLPPDPIQITESGFLIEDTINSSFPSRTIERSATFKYHI